MSIANSWRMSGDIYDSFSRPDDLCSCDQASDPFCIAPGSHCSVLKIINRVATFVDRAQFGGWNDLDMLEVGNGGMTDDEVSIAPFPLVTAVGTLALQYFLIAVNYFSIYYVLGNYDHNFKSV